MSLSQILNKVTSLNKVSECLNNNIRLSLSNLENGEKSLLIHHINKSAVVVCKDFVSLTEIKQSLELLGHKVGALTYGYNMPVFSYKEDNSSMQEFLSTLYDFNFNKLDYLLVLPETLLQRLPNRQNLDQNISFTKGQNYTFSNIANTLSSLGYQRVDYVSKKGEFSIRGDIVDLFLVNNDDPVRLDFFGDELEKISEFDLDTMKSYSLLDNIVVYPSTFYLINNKLLTIYFHHIIYNAKIHKIVIT